MDHLSQLREKVIPYVQTLLVKLAGKEDRAAFEEASTFTQKTWGTNLTRYALAHPIHGENRFITPGVSLVVGPVLGAGGAATTNLLTGRDAFPNLWVTAVMWVLTSVLTYLYLTSSSVRHHPTLAHNVEVTIAEYGLPTRHVQNLPLSQVTRVREIEERYQGEGGTMSLILDKAYQRILGGVDELISQETPEVQEIYRSLEGEYTGGSGSVGELLDAARAISPDGDPTQANHKGWALAGLRLGGAR